MITEDILRKFKSNLLIEDIPVPHRTQRAKLVCHVDLDGLISGITMVHQLQKQGIPKERIKIEYAQYGDEDKERHKHTEKFIGRKGEFTGVTDFAKLPRAKPYEIFNKLMDFKGNKEKFVSYMKSRDWSKVSLENFKKDFLSKFQVKQTKWTNGNLKELHEAFVSYYELPQEKRPELTLDTIEKVKYQVVNPDFVSDHHSNGQGALSGGKTGGIAVPSPSEAEHLADKYAPGFWPKEDIAAVSMVDSAGYNIDQLQNTIFLQKQFTGPNKKKNLATIISCVYDNMVKKDREAGKWVIKNAGTNLVSVYTTTLKAAGYSGKRLEYLDALKKGDVAKAREMLKEIPDILNKGYDRHKEPAAKIMTRDAWEKKNVKDFEDAKSGSLTDKEKKEFSKLKDLSKTKKQEEPNKSRIEELSKFKGKITVKDNFAIFDGTVSKVQYSRFATSLYSQNGMRSPFTLRYWGSFFQVAKNTLYKGEVDFDKVNDHVLEDIKNYLLKHNINETKVDNIIENMREKNGGHAGGIWSFQGFDKIKASHNELDDKYFKAQAVLRKNSKNKLAGEVSKRYISINSKYKRLREGAFKLAMDSAIKWTNKLCPVDKTKIDNLKNSDPRFEGKIR